MEVEVPVENKKKLFELLSGDFTLEELLKLKQ
jgi:hypothetical protein